MGTLYKFRCNKCNYEVMTSGGLDYGMHAVTETYLCKYCNNLVDVMVGETGIIYTKEEALQKKAESGIDTDFYSCPRCGSDKDLLKWDKTKRACPKCDGKLNKDLKGNILQWD